MKRLKRKEIRKRRHNDKREFEYEFKRKPSRKRGYDDSEDDYKKEIKNWQ